MPRRAYTVLLIAFCVVGLCRNTDAATWSLQANLDGLQEVPPNASPAFGLADLTLDDVTGAVAVTTASYQDLLGGSTAATINDAAIGMNGPIITVLTLDQPAATSGTISGSGVLNATQITDMLNGNTYLNIRSQVFPSGEIRGQLFVVPEPASAMAIALAAVPLLIRRRTSRTV